MRRPLTLLLVEDDVEDALLFRKRCPPGFAVQHMTTAERGLDVLRRGVCDVCFTDYRLGAAGTGLDLVRQARAEGLRTPIVVITGEDLESLAENALLAGATDFLPKNDLDGAAIERAARWALIRRHVENGCEDGITEQAIARLTGCLPGATRPASEPPAAGGLRRVLYLSRARASLSAQELLLMCSGFATANARTHITGVLVYARQCFVQVIEGDRDAVAMLMRRIESDTRHGDLNVVFEEPTRARLFDAWNMGVLQLGLRSEWTPLQWEAAGVQLARLWSEQGTTREGVARLIRALPSVLGSSSPSSLAVQSRADVQLCEVRSA